MIFRDLDGKKCVIVNTFMEGKEQVVTYRYWLKLKRRWVFKTDFTRLFIIAFDYGWRWEFKNKNDCTSGGRKES